MNTKAGTQACVDVRRRTERATEEDPATIYVVDDDGDTRDLLTRIIATVGWRTETYADGDSFLAGHDTERPGCVLLDIRMPGKSGLDVQAILAERGDPRPIILMTAYADVPTAIRAMRAGAADFIEKPFGPQDLLERIRRALLIDRRERAARAAKRAAQSRYASLTPREREVLDLLLDGKGNRQIAAALAVSPRTVETHRDRVMIKMGAGSFAALIRLTLLLDQTDDDDPRVGRLDASADTLAGRSDRILRARTPFDAGATEPSHRMLL